MIRLAKAYKRAEEVDNVRRAQPTQRGTSGTLIAENQQGMASRVLKLS